MARLQILELPEVFLGEASETPFVLVVDEMPTDEAAFEALRRDLSDVAQRIGARAVLAFEATVDIPANDTSAYLRDAVESGAEAERDELHAELGLAQGQLHSAALSAIRGKHANIHELIGRAEQAEAERDEARSWARHGYEIGQKHCGWSDHGVAPYWLTEGWPNSFDSCEHLKRAAELEEAEAIRKRVAKEMKAALTDELGMDRLRDWDDIRNAATALRQSNEARGEAIDRVNKLHQPVEHRGQVICWACSDCDFPGQTTDSPPVAYDQCATLKALTGYPVPDA